MRHQPLLCLPHRKKGARCPAASAAELHAGGLKRRAQKSRGAAPSAFSFFYLLPLGFGLTVEAAVGALFTVGEREDLRQFLLDGGDAARVFAADDVPDPLRQLQLALFHALAVLDDVDGDAGVDVADHVPVEVQDAVDLDDILAAELAADDVFEQRHGAVELVEAEDVVQVHRLAGGDMVNDNTVGNRINNHVVALPYSIPSSLRISAMRM